MKELLHGKTMNDRFSWPSVDRYAKAFKKCTVPCTVRQVDTMDYELQSGDIILGRIGSKPSILRPYLIVKH